MKFEGITAVVAGADATLADVRLVLDEHGEQQAVAWLDEQHDDPSWWAAQRHPEAPVIRTPARREREEITPEQCAQMFTAVSDALAGWVSSMGEVFSQIGKAVLSVQELLQSDLILVDRGLSPRERALAARQGRSTGPHPGAIAQQRRPREHRR